MLDIYTDHKGHHVKLLPVRNLDEVRELADIYASNRQDTLLRVFGLWDGSGPRFITAYSVLDGVVREHADVTIPADHW